MTSIAANEKLTVNGEHCTAYAAYFNSSTAEQRPARCQPIATNLKEAAEWASRQNLVLVDGDLVLFNGEPHEVKIHRGDDYRYPVFYPLHPAEEGR